MISSMIFSSADVSLDLLRPSLFFIDCGKVLPALERHVVKILQHLAGDRADSTRSADTATPFIEIGDSSISRPFAFSRPINSLWTRFATRFGFLAAFAAASNWSASALRDGEHRASCSVIP